MTKLPPRLVLPLGIMLGLFALSSGLIASARAADPPGSDASRLFRDKIAPVLKAECYACHSAEAKKVRGGLRLDSRELLLQGGDSGPAVEPGKAGESLLIQAIRHQDGMAMPPKKPRLSEQTIADFERWVNAGAPYSSAGENQPSAASRDAAGPRALGVPSGQEARPAEGRRSRLGEEPDRRLRPREARIAGGGIPHRRPGAPSGSGA